MKLQFSKEEIRFYTRRAIWIFLSWVVISNILFLYEYITLKDANALDSSFDFPTSFNANLIVSGIAGLIGGIFTVNLMEVWLRKFAFWKALLFIAFLYGIVAVMIATIGAGYYYSDYMNLTLTDPELWQEVRVFFKSWLFIKNFVIWLFIVLGTLIVLMINDKYGPGVFPDYLMGRYFLPKKERRIFMFADIKDATTIAEDIGEKKYFNFLKDFFNDIAPAIMQTQGEVYQYVGDEVVITWKMKRGLRNANALRCFYVMKKSLSRKRTRYERKYGHFPDFKVGLHCGSIMVGELGKIKRDIAFSGDVLNTTARIQAACNEKKTDILASTNFANLLFKLPKNVKKVTMGDEILKGKSEEVSLVTFTRSKSS